MYTEQQIEEIYNKHADMVMRICSLNLKNQQDAQDVLQDVFLKLFTSGKHFDSTEHEKAWLIRVAINKCKDYKKSFWKRNIKSIEYVDIPFESQMESDVIDAVLSLSPKYKNIIFLFYYQGYAVPEIAKILEQKESTIYSNLHRARKELKKKLGADIYEDAF